MRHGIEPYFEEYRRFERRLAGLMFSVSALALLSLAVARVTGPLAVEDEARRFGFEGPEELVARILFETRGPRDMAGPRLLGDVADRDARRGGSGRAGQAREPTGETAPAARGRGPGSDELDLLQRARMIAMDAPVVRSEELVIERLVRPDYPEAARANDLEGTVELVARVDTTGSVTEVHIVGGSGNADFEQAATQAVLQCRYRPYRVDQEVRPVFAAFRIRFTLF